MPSRRAFAIALVTSLLAMPATALAQSASNDQYKDPFGDGGSSSSGGGHKSSGGGGGSSSSGSGGSGSSSSSGSGSSGDANLSSDPQVDPSLTTPPPINGSTSAAATTKGGKTLPRTGIDLRVLAGVGAALLLIGIGLRLRTADVRRF